MKKITMIGLRIVGILGGTVLLIGVGGYLYLRVKAPHFITIARNIEEDTVTISLEELDRAVFVQGMNACENLYVDKETMRVYVTDLGGSLHLLDGESREQLKIVKSLKMGQFGLGIDKGPDGSLYVGFSQYDTQGWIEQGGAIYRVDPELHQPVKLTTDYPTMNGLACDSAGRCYFASSNFDFFHPKGNVYMMQIAPNGSYSEPEIFLQDIGLANGLHYNTQENRMYLSDTLETVSSFIPGEQRLEVIYRKTKYMESTDDICTDHQGNLWMSDPFESTLKQYNPKTKQLVRYDIEGIGQTSACGIREEDGEEVLYITEIKTKRAPMSDVYDGRGLLIVPVNSLTTIRSAKE
ncbi:MAG: SMP-30/gluconolactonase/LRE family protein [Thermodesulfobacteriota bacterium]|nr:SMP-30/gluconolactonase/LRE family protein [Thermodesulfobacteriota bacterium]